MLSAVMEWWVLPLLLVSIYLILLVKVVHAIINLVPGLGLVLSTTENHNTQYIAA